MCAVIVGGCVALRLFGGVERACGLVLCCCVVCWQRVARSLCGGEICESSAAERKRRWKEEGRGEREDGGEGTGVFEFTKRFTSPHLDKGRRESRETKRVSKLAIDPTAFRDSPCCARVCVVDHTSIAIIERHSVCRFELSLPSLDLLGIHGHLRRQKSERLHELAVGVSGQLAGDVQERLRERAKAGRKKEEKKKRAKRGEQTRRRGQVRDRPVPEVRACV